MKAPPATLAKTLEEPRGEREATKTLLGVGFVVDVVGIPNCVALREGAVVTV